MIFAKYRGLCAALAAAGILLGGAAGAEAASREEIAQISVDEQGSNFQYWREGAVARQKLMEYVQEVTDINSPHYIPVEDRLAVFDMDGTIIGETTPYYFEWMLYLDRIYNDPSYKPAEQILQNAEIVRRAIAEKAVTKEIDVMETADKITILAGLNDEEFHQVVVHAMEQPVPGMANVKYGEMIYLPMVEVLSYLQANDFTLYIVSGGYRQIVRSFARGVLPVPPNHIIGSDTVLKATNQGDMPAGEYLFDVDRDEIVTGDNLLEKNDLTAKPIKISREIGKKPVLSFGNSMGDAAMHQYTLSNRKYKTMVFELLCDDVEREYGNPAKAEKIRKACEQYGWVPVSMRDDWQTIYGEDVRRQ